MYYIRQQIVIRAENSRQGGATQRPGHCESCIRSQVKSTDGTRGWRFHRFLRAPRSPALLLLGDLRRHYAAWQKVITLYTHMHVDSPDPRPEIARPPGRCRV